MSIFVSTTWSGYWAGKSIQIPHPTPTVWGLEAVLANHSREQTLIYKLFIVGRASQQPEHSDCDRPLNEWCRGWVERRKKKTEVSFLLRHGKLHGVVKDSSRWSNHVKKSGCVDSRLIIPARQRWVCRFQKGTGRRACACLASIIHSTDEKNHGCFGGGGSPHSCDKIASDRGKKCNKKWQIDTERDKETDECK